jgi:hypothetical protein
MLPDLFKRLAALEQRHEIRKSRALPMSDERAQAARLASMINDPQTLAPGVLERLQAILGPELNGPPDLAL